MYLWFPTLTVSTPRGPLNRRRKREIGKRIDLTSLDGGRVITGVVNYSELICCHHHSCPTKGPGPRA